MLCSMCHKNEAVICYTEIVNGMKKEQYLCPECAAKYTAFDGDAPGMTPGSLLAGLLTSVLGQAGVAREDDSKKTNLACKKCGMTYNEFLKYSKFGCSECVHTFGFLLDDYLKKIQGSSEHCGKVYPGPETVFVPEVSFVSGDKSRGAGTPDDKSSAAKAGSESVRAHSASDGSGTGTSDGGPESISGAPNAASAVAAGDSSAVMALKRQLAAAIKAEEYEEAARIRDAIKAQRAADTAADGAAKEATVDEKMV